MKHDPLMTYTIETRKANYWRGFRACLVLVVAPLVIFLVLFCNYIINNLVY